METPLKSTDKIVTRMGKVEDVEPLLQRFALPYFVECGFDAFAQLDLPQAIETMRGQVTRGDTPFIVAEVNGDPVGFVSYTLDQVFTARPLAYLHLIYVEPKWRRTPIGRALIAMAMHVAQGDGACAFFATIPPRRPSLNNMLVHAGFEPMGGAYMRRL